MICREFDSDGSDEESRHLLRPVIKCVAVAAVLVLTLTPILTPSYTHLPTHYQELAQRCEGPNPPLGCANPFHEKVFIATILYDKHGKLAGGKWGQRVIELINLLGPENVFLSIYENDSGAEGQDALYSLKRKVPCRHHIVSEEHVSLDQFHNITFPDGSRRTKRVAYLSELRNRALRPLDSFKQEDGITVYDKVLFLNDVAFHPVDAAHLLFNTNQRPDGRADYVAACAVDWFRPFRIYDIYALRDAEGYANYQMTFPFFLNRGKGASRADVLAQTDAVRVKSCWGGMMAMQAKYIQNLNRYKPSHTFDAPNAHVIDPDNPRNITAPVRFRYEPGTYYDACECCLFSADLAEVARQDGVDTGGIVMNPYIRVAYTDDLLRWLPVVRRWERLLIPVFQLQSWLTPRAENPYRAVKEGEPFTEEIWDGDQWRFVTRLGRSGLFCGVRDMQVLRQENKRSTGSAGVNWVNTRMPPGQKQKFRSWWGIILPPTWREDWAAASPADRKTFFEYSWD
ncbi:cryptococcal mannosyltransferase 1-domain-containing protein [Bombardia bombarda]|uniref:Cryptococcal mannosyltransferase 1-domain-containing protein n=1 Tax=Bombardia bombarda TaxID=252184 RepID=A0AA39X8A5_9PEZI|nr:cryptococcal mannosyltransferase 1-domain-containing protein [Bombardia bombarda]